MAGFDNEVVYGSNVDFTGNSNVTGQVTSDGQLLIGSTAAPNIKVGTITSSNSTLVITNGSGTIDIVASSGISGDVDGPGSSTDNAVVRWDGTTGKLIQNSATILDDNDNISGLGSISARGNVTISRSISGDGVICFIANTSNTAGSYAKLDLAIAGSSAGNPQITFTRTGSGTKFAIGTDTSDSDTFKIGASTLSGSTRFSISIAGVTKNHQGYAVNVTSTATSYTVLDNDFMINVTSNAAARTITLPQTPATGQMFVIKDAAGTAASANNITIDTTGAPTIDGANTYLINSNYGSITVVFDGTNYFVI